MVVVCCYLFVFVCGHCVTLVALILFSVLSRFSCSSFKLYFDPHNYEHIYAHAHALRRSMRVRSALAAVLAACS